MFDMDLGAAAGSAEMPPMVLLPLVDYAFASVAEHGTLRITVRADDTTLRFEVATTGGSRDTTAAAGEKLATLRGRLDTLYGDSGEAVAGQPQRHDHRHPRTAS